MSSPAEDRETGKTPRRLYTTYQVADLLGATPGAVVDWMQKGWLPYQRLSDGPVRITEKGLLKFLKDRGIAIELVMAKAVLREQHRRRKGKRATGPGHAADPLGLPAIATTDGTENPPADEQAEGVKVSAEADDQPRPADEESPEKLTRAEFEALMETDPSPEIDRADQPTDESDLEQVAPDERERIAEPEAEPVDIQPDAPGPAFGPAAQVVEAVFRDAVACGASHVHLSYDGQKLSLRLRIHGVLRDKPAFAERLPAGLAPRVVDYLKSLASLEDEPLRRVRSGEFRTSAGDGQIEMRMSVMPSVEGEKIVIRLVRPATDRAGLAELGMDGADEASLRAMLARPAGLIILTAPPRNAAGQTILAMLDEMRTSGRNVLTIEKKLAGPLEGASRTQVDTHRGLSFAEVAEAIDEQDADVVMIGEMRDPATAAAAVEAAVNGAFVLARMYAPDPVEAIEELFEMGIEPWPLGSVLQAVIAQRSVRRLCENCRKPLEGDAQSLAIVGLNLSKTDRPIFGPKGCDRCAGTGFAGRINLFSMMRISSAVKSAIRRSAPMDVLNEAVRLAGTRSLRDAARKAIFAGLISPAQCRHALTW